MIGGGSGGLACARHAATLGARVGVFDFVKPSPQGTTWGIGGTCVNVGCIPKKLMHYASILGDGFHDAMHLGWTFSDKPKMNWTAMVQTVHNYIKKLNDGYIEDLADKDVQYFNSIGRFIDPHTVGFADGNQNGGEFLVNGYFDPKKENKVTAKYIVIAVGGRPRYLDIPGAELAISSDDIFWMQNPPGKTLCIGASYISLETAGFLNEFGFETHVMVRSILLRGFDRECAELIGNYMEESGCNFHYGSTPEKFEQRGDGRILVTWKQKDQFGEGCVETKQDVFDTVMFATGRTADTAGLNLQAAGVVTAKNGKFDTVNEATNVPHIFAIGDVVNGKAELTPVAIQAGKLLVERLFNGSTKTMNYENIATTVFTPLEYGNCGLSEEDAIERYGEDNIKIYWKKFTALEKAAVPTIVDNPHLAKLIVHKESTDVEKVIGFHYLGPNAGEVSQGFGLALKYGATKEDFDNLVGIHPTTAENFTILDKLKGEAVNSKVCAT